MTNETTWRIVAVAAVSLALVTSFALAIVLVVAFATVGEAVHELPAANSTVMGAASSEDKDSSTTIHPVSQRPFSRAHLPVHSTDGPAQ